MGNLNPGFIGLQSNPNPPDLGCMTEEVEERVAELLENHREYLLQDVIFQDTELIREFEAAVLAVVGMSRTVGAMNPCICTTAKAITEVFEQAAEKVARKELDRPFASLRIGSTEYINGGFA